MAGKNLSDDYIFAIGDLVTSATYLESIITDLIGVFTGMHIANTIMTVGHQQFASKVDTFKALYSFGSDEDFDPKTDGIFALLDQAAAIGGFRNTVVHAHWWTDDKGETYAVRFTARGKFSRTRTPYKSEEIRAKAREADALAQRLSELRDYLIANPPTPPEDPEAD